MFYYPNVLHRHTGCFSTIWLAATRGIRVTRREFLKVNVRRTCGDILDYVTAQVPPPQPNVPKPRFSLYLSSQLQYGVVVVYHRQCHFLLEEVQQTIDRLLRSKRCIRIDMAESDRLALDVPDNLCLLEEAERAQDPFFGLMESHELPSPYKIHQPVMVGGQAASQHSLLSSPHSTLSKEGFRSPPAAITLTEKEQPLTTAECFEGDDLPEATAREINLLMVEPDQLRGEEDTERRTRDLEGAMTSIDQLKDSVLAAEWDSVWLLDKEAGLPTELPPAAAGREMTPPQVALPAPPSGSPGRGGRETGSPREEAPPLRKPGGARRRQLVFADPQVQICDRAMKEQIGNPLAETVDLAEVLLDLTKFSSPAQLFSAPCGSLVRDDLQLLWKRRASVTALPGEGEESEREREREILRTERKRRQSSMREISSESGLQAADGSSVLDVSKEDAITPASRWSPQEEAQLPMEPIAEENIEMPDAQMEAESRNMLKWIFCSLHGCAEVSFGSLLPSEADRSAAAFTLYKVLELLSAGQVTVQQCEPYSDITITACEHTHTHTHTQNTHNTHTHTHTQALPTDGGKEIMSAPHHLSF